MSESKGFILKAEQYNQEEWCEMFRRVSETCKNLKTENECLENQLQQKENILKEVREYINENEDYFYNYPLVSRERLLEILEKENK